MTALTADLLRAAEIVENRSRQLAQSLYNEDGESYIALASRLREATEKCVCVPREPTVGMLKAGGSCEGMRLINSWCADMQLARGRTVNWSEDNPPLAQAYRAMLAAAALSLEAQPVACPYCTSTNDAIRGTFYDQNCAECVARMTASPQEPARTPFGICKHCGADLEPREQEQAPQVTEEELAAMVDRFLAWPLPDSVCSDTCVTERNFGVAQGWPKRSGTSLLTADEAEQMLRHVLRLARRG